MKKNWIAALLLGAMFCLSGCAAKPAEEKTIYETEGKPTEETNAVDELPSPTVGSPTVLQGSLIEEQTFDIMLDSWGAVTFASYAPEDSTSASSGLYPDVRFYLLENGTPLYEFPGWNDEHVTADRFISVIAVAFRDYNDDGLWDVITICEYETESGVRFPTARVYFQLEHKRGFEEDTLLTEYLSKQQRADTISAVMGAKEDYWDYLSAMDGHRSAYKQMQVIAENAELWSASPDFANDVYRYAVVDLDRNGRYEVIVSNMGGTGQYTYSRFFEVNDSYDGLTECTTDFVEGDSQPDMIVERLDTYINSNGEFFYAVHDLTKNGAAEYYEAASALSLTDGSITSAPIAYKATVYIDGSPNVTCRDSNGNDISEAAYADAVNIYFAGYEKTVTCLGWQDMRELAGSTEEIAAQLSASFDVYLESEL